MKMVGYQQTKWFLEWTLVDEGFLPAVYPRSIVLLHPGTMETDDPSMPFSGPDAADADLTDKQAKVLDQVLLESFGPETPCVFGRYGGYLEESHRSELTARGLARVANRLTYYLGAGPLSAGL